MNATFFGAGRVIRHDPQHDDPYLETDIGKCPECEGKGCETTSVYLDRIIGRLGAAAVQRSFHDDRIIADHIDEALAAAQALKAELAKEKASA